jgi:hypothetical protein
MKYGKLIKVVILKKIYSPAISIRILKSKKNIFLFLIYLSMNNIATKSAINNTKRKIKSIFQSPISTTFFMKIQFPISEKNLNILLFSSDLPYMPIKELRRRRKNIIISITFNKIPII